MIKHRLVCGTRNSVVLGNFNVQMHACKFIEVKFQSRFCNMKSVAMGAFLGDAMPLRNPLIRQFGARLAYSFSRFRRCFG